ncbi:hypothetical protein T492DRAFT_919584 [Pavlovales sp. CCMP2436]|nr:hypothetical protein T492DRAFT_919584 [Pavlovales sp. CCMP2436]
MLYADKRALETNLKVSLLQIREKELNFYTQNCLAVGTQSALLAGFAYAGLTQVSVPPEAPYVVRLLYLLFTTAAMSCELIAVLNTTLLSMLGPGLALRGPDGSMHQAVDGMMLEYRRAFFTFALGLLAFHMSALMFGWLMFRPLVASSMTVCILVALRVLWRYVVRIFAKFQLPKDMVVSGRFAAETDGVDPNGDGVVMSGLIHEQQAMAAAAGLGRAGHGAPPVGAGHGGPPAGHAGGSYGAGSSSTAAVNTLTSAEASAQIAAKQSWFKFM